MCEYYANATLCLTPFIHGRENVVQLLSVRSAQLPAASKSVVEALELTASFREYNLFTQAIEFVQE